MAIWGSIERSFFITINIWSGCRSIVRYEQRVVEWDQDQLTENYGR